MTYDITRKSGQRVVRADVRCQKCLVPSYSELKNHQIYPLLLPSFLIDGGDGYSMFTEEKLTQERFSKFKIEI